MQNIDTFKGTLTNIKRLPNSINGNPRYTATILIGKKIKNCQYEITFKTGVDCSHGYSLTNFDGKKVIATIGWHYNSLTLNTIKGAK